MYKYQAGQKVTYKRFGEFYYGAVIVERRQEMPFATPRYVVRHEGILYDALENNLCPEESSMPYEPYISTTISKDQFEKSIENVKTYDLSLYKSSEIFDRLRTISAYENTKVILPREQLTTEIIELARIRNIEIEVVNVDWIEKAIEKTNKELDLKYYMLEGIFDPNADYDMRGKEMKFTRIPSKVIFNDKKKATTLLFNDDVKVVKATEGDEYDRKYGFLMAYFQHMSGMSKTQANKYLTEIVKEKENL